VKKVIPTLGFIAGLLMAGSEGPIYINFIGLGVFLLSCKEI